MFHIRDSLFLHIIITKAFLHSKSNIGIKICKFQLLKNKQMEKSISNKTLVFLKKFVIIFTDKLLIGLYCGRFFNYIAIKYISNIYVINSRLCYNHSL